MPTIATLGAASARAFGLFGSSAVTDPYFFYNTLLLPGNGTNGAQNNTFLDSSTNNFTITRNGNTTQGTFTPYGSNWSNYFNGTDAYLITGTSSNLTLANNADWTVEAWIFLSASTYQQILFNSGGGSDSWSTQHNCDFAVNSSGFLSFEYSASGTSTSVAGTTATTRNAWNHIAWVFNGTSKTLTTYVNGVRDLNATSVSGYTPPNATPRITIGRTDPTVPNPYQWWVTGYISNVRVVRGSQVYSGATITVPTGPLTAITNTSLLTCQSNRFIDNSSNAFAVTVNGSPSVQRFSPFNPSAPYAAGTIGGSGYFDSSGDSLTQSGSTIFNFSGDYTVEFWIYSTGTVPGGGFGNIVGPTSGGSNVLNFGLGASNVIGSSSSTTQYNSSTFLINYQWNHIAYCRTGSTLYILLNGARIATLTAMSGAYSGGSGISICSADAYGFKGGYLADVRVTSGAMLYPNSTYTVPTSPLTTTVSSGTVQLLTNFTNGGIIDNAMMNDLETVGNAQISTSVSKFGGGSLAFDGSGDTLNVPANTQSVLLGSGPFTIEFWLYPAASQTSTRTPIISFGNGFTTNVWIIQLNNTSPSYVNRIQFWCYNLNSGAVVAASTGTIAATTWTHVALVRNGNVFTIYINGTADGTGTYSGSIDGGSTTLQLQVGFNSPDYFNGNIDDLRITKGYARYTANFTPPTAAFPLS